MDVDLTMEAALIAAKGHGRIETVAIQGFCTGIGKMMPGIAAAQMHQAYTEIEKGEKPRHENFADARMAHRRLNPPGRIFE